MPLQLTISCHFSYDTNVPYYCAHVIVARKMAQLLMVAECTLHSKHIRNEKYLNTCLARTCLVPS